MSDLYPSINIMLCINIQRISPSLLYDQYIHFLIEIKQVKLIIENNYKLTATKRVS